MMQSFINSTGAFIRDEDGVTAIEYGLMAALIATAILAGYSTLATAVSDKFTAIAGHVTSGT
ncbi:pilus assembly protein Flp/PilA [Burkholderia sp. OAS925]|jgi:pilus assembly protein Flp/PilA|nr:pilus assembly protein Flp/PilA [Paraburkholderia graminis]MDR6205690.1 pilus assembly protein Flp/PilA [Paraburkholderia graminis]